MEVFHHHIYEFRKGIRNLVLHTMHKNDLDSASAKLERENIAYLVCPLDNGNVNIFFGDRDCVDVVKTFGKKRLNEYTPEEDFILGIMLGYGRLAQCQRYLFRCDGFGESLPDFKKQAAG